jgi:oligopeptide transport system ATP-binding protein
MSREILEVSNLKKNFHVNGRILKAVDDVSFSIPVGKTFSLVGESGCGKTTCGRMVTGMYEPTEGTVLFEGQDISQFGKSEKKNFYKDVQMIFQDPYSSLDPRMNVGTIVGEGRKIYFRETKEQRREAICRLLESVNLPEAFLARFPHELSGGQRQRVGIARALALDPKLLVCDEPIAALDVSIQAQVINILMKLQEERKLTYLFISHDLTVVRHISDEIGVMYLGALVEKAPAEELFAHRLHPYTRALLSSVMRGRDENWHLEESVRLKGELPSPINAPKGCRFCTRCPYATDKCRAERPAFTEVSPGHYAACFQLSNIAKEESKDEWLSSQQPVI